MLSGAVNGVSGERAGFKTLRAVKYQNGERIILKTFEWKP